MLRAETTNNCTSGIDTNHSTTLTSLLDLNVICEQSWIQFELQNSPSRVYAFDGKIHYHLANLWNRITTKNFDIFRIITLKQQKFSQSDPDLIQQISKKLQSDPVLIRPKLVSVLVQSDPVLIRAHLISDEHGSGLGRIEPGLKLILAGSGLDRTAIFLKICGSGLDRTKKIFVGEMWLF